MIRIFNHWMRARVVGQMLFDLSFVIVGLVIAIMWVGHGLPVNFSQVVVYGGLLGIVMLLVNAWLGFYERHHNRNVSETRARAVLSLYLAVPLAYAIFALLPMTSMNKEFVQLSAMSAIFGMLVTRVSATHTANASKAISRRILVFGTGTRALDVKRELNKSDPAAEIVGFFPSPVEEEHAIPSNLIFSRATSLTDTAKELKADEIVVAITERRGGAMPLRELLDCKLHGIKVLDLASHFEQTLGQIRLDSLYAGWLIFGDGFQQGTLRTVVKRLFDIVCALILITLALPVMLIAALAIVIENGFPILYRQERVGLNGRLFKVSTLR